MAKADLIAEAQNLGITLSGEETVAQLNELIAAAKPAESSEKTEFAVHNASGSYIRTYSLADHGPDAEKLAHQFAGKIGGSVQ